MYLFYLLSILLFSPDWIICHWLEFSLIVKLTNFTHRLKFLPLTQRRTWDATRCLQNIATPAQCPPTHTLICAVEVSPSPLIGLIAGGIQWCVCVYMCVRVHARVFVCVCVHVRVFLTSPDSFFLFVQFCSSPPGDNPSAGSSVQCDLPAIRGRQRQGCRTHHGCG